MNNTRICRKCQSIIPNKFYFNNKTYNLRNRKFCLTCSPFKQHNTSKYDPIERIKNKEGYRLYTENQKEIIKKSLYKRAYERKINLIKSKGGHCKNCGYNKCLRALTFHHRDPSKKLFGLSLNNLWSKSLNDIEIESSKCDLLCSNCHAELEDQVSNLNCSNILKDVKISYNLI